MVCYDMLYGILWVDKDIYILYDIIYDILRYYKMLR